MNTDDGMNFDHIIQQPFIYQQTVQFEKRSLTSDPVLPKFQPIVALPLGLDYNYEQPTTSKRSPEISPEISQNSQSKRPRLFKELSTKNVLNSGFGAAHPSQSLAVVQYKKLHVVDKDKLSTMTVPQKYIEQQEREDMYLRLGREKLEAGLYRDPFYVTSLTYKLTEEINNSWEIHHFHNYYKTYMIKNPFFPKQQFYVKPFYLTAIKDPSDSESNSSRESIVTSTQKNDANTKSVSYDYTDMHKASFTELAKMLVESRAEAKKYRSDLLMTRIDNENLVAASNNLKRKMSDLLEEVEDLKHLNPNVIRVD